jgi:hypothetical protein
MLKLCLSPILLGSRVTLGPAPWFRFEGSVIREGPLQSPVAELRNHQWNAKGRHFIQLWADGDHPRVRFAAEGDGTSVEYGPFDEVHWTDGAMYADGLLLARFDDATQQWVCTATRQVFPVMVLVSEEARAHGAH